MAELYARRTCDICGGTVAYKKRFVFKAEQSYTTVKFQGEHGKYFICSACYDRLCNKLRNRLEGEAER